MSILFYRQSSGRHVFSSITSERKCIGLFLIRNFKTKKTKAKRSVPPTARALEHFDVHYKPHFKDLWPSIRLAFLTAKKGSAVINTYADSDRFEDKFVELGAFDVVENARMIQANSDYSASTLEEDLKNRSVIVDQLAKNLDGGNFDESNYSFESKLTDNSDQSSNVLQQNDSENERTVEIDRKDLDAFMPVQKLYTDTDRPFVEEVTQTVYSPLDMRMDIVKPARLSLPKRLRVYCFPTGDVSRFPTPKIDHIGGHLSFFMMDAASILPVIALDLQEGDNVLDLCAAPGGKSLCILQTGLAGQLTCNDISKSRLNRLRNIMNYHIPEESRGNVTIEKADGTQYEGEYDKELSTRGILYLRMQGLEESGDNVIIERADDTQYEGEYDKVLVDVPCNTDRHMLLDDFNNLYSPPRTGERLAIPETQKDLLVAAIKCCRSGGSVVYSTCTLAAAQNDGTVQQAFDEIMRTTDIQIVIEDLTELSQIFQETFRFYDGCRLGQLVIPTILANFGPMYICKIKRVE